jgi:hypothetical protein
MPDEKNGALANLPADVPAKISGPTGLAELLLKEQKPAVCSFDLKSAAGRELMQKCEESPDQPVRELANTEFRLQHVYARVFDYTNKETGEVYPLLRICLVSTDGKVHACASDGIRESLLRLMAGHGLPPWKDGIPVRIAIKALGNSRQRLTLLEVFDAPKGGKRT